MWGEKDIPQFIAQKVLFADNFRQKKAYPFTFANSFLFTLTNYSQTRFIGVTKPYITASTTAALCSLINATRQHVQNLSTHFLL